MSHIVDETVPIKIIEARDGFLVLKNNFCTFYLAIGNFDIYKYHDSTFIRTPGQRFKVAWPVEELLHLIASHNTRVDRKLEKINKSIDKISKRLDKFEVDIELAPGGEESLKAKEHFEENADHENIEL